MEEKILITSKLDNKWEKFLIGIVLFFLGLAFICLLIAILYEYNGYLNWSYEYYPDFATDFSSNWYGGVPLLFIAINWAFLLFAGIATIVFFALKKCELQITEKNVVGKSWFGKKVLLPISQISAYSTRRFLSVVSIATSSGFTKFALIANYEEIGNVLHNLINQRQEATKFTASDSIESHNDLDDLKKLKELLDNGIISQEEFDAKKKQILGF